MSRTKSIVNIPSANVFLVALPHSVIVVLCFSSVQFLATLWTVAHRVCPWDFLGKDTGVGCHFPPPGDIPHPGIQPLFPMSLALQTDSSPAEPSGKPLPHAHL